jgi:transposase-like protein
MRKSKFTDSQIMDAVKRVEAGFGVPDICREMGISTATFYKWRAKYGCITFLLLDPLQKGRITDQPSHDLLRRSVILNDLFAFRPTL